MEVILREMYIHSYFTTSKYQVLHCSLRGRSDIVGLVCPPRSPQASGSNPTLSSSASTFLLYSSSPPPHHLLDGVGNRMVLQAAYTALTTVLPTKYWPHAAVVAAILVVIYAYTQGPTTNRERDLHARIIILTVSSSFLSPLREIAGKRAEGLEGKCTSPKIAPRRNVRNPASRQFIDLSQPLFLFIRAPYRMVAWSSRAR